MANIYVDSNAAGTADGSTWADAYTTLDAALAVESAGDRIWIASDHAESSATSLTYTIAATHSLPTWIVSADKTSGEPPTTLAAGAAITTTGTAPISWRPAATCYTYGLVFSVGTGASSGCRFEGAFANDAFSIFEECSFLMVNANANTEPHFGSLSSGVESRARLINCTFRFAHASQNVMGDQCWLSIIGGSLLSGGTSPTAMFGSGTDQSRIDVEGFDLSNASAGVMIFLSGTGPGVLYIRNSKLPASWSGGIGTNSTPLEQHILHNCDDGDTNYKLWTEDYAGSVVDETTIVRSGGATESRKMVSTANAEFPEPCLRGPEIVRYNSTTGSSLTVTLEFVHDSVTALQNDEFWIEVQYLGTSGFPLSLFADSRVADVLATPADTTDSSESWTTTGMTNPNTRKCTVTFTPQEVGYVHVVPCLAVASTTVYYDPEIAVA